MGPFSIPLSGFDWNCADTHEVRNQDVHGHSKGSDFKPKLLGQGPGFSAPFSPFFSSGFPSGQNAPLPQVGQKGIALMNSRDRALHSLGDIEEPLKEPPLFKCEAVSIRGGLSSLGYHHAHLGPLFRGEAEVASLDPLVQWVLGNFFQLHSIHIN